MNNKNEITSPFYSTPSGYECETIYGVFHSVAKFKNQAKKELADWLDSNRAVAGEFEEGSFKS
jgi:hypothetical protein